MECVAGLASSNQGRTRDLIMSCMRHVGPGFQCVDGIYDLREVTAMSRPRWLASFPRIDDWTTLSNRDRQDVTAASWDFRPSSLRASGVLVPHYSNPELALTEQELRLVRDHAFRPRGFPERTLNGLSEMPTLPHSMASLRSPCACGCRSSGLSLTRLRDRGAFITVVANNAGLLRLPSPSEMARLMCFPHAQWWYNGPQRLLLSLLGNAISPPHAILALAKLTVVEAWTSGGSHAQPSTLVNDLMQQSELSWRHKGPYDKSVYPVDPADERVTIQVHNNFGNPVHIKLCPSITGDQLMDMLARTLCCSLSDHSLRLGSREIRSACHDFVNSTGDRRLSPAT